MADSNIDVRTGGDARLHSTVGRRDVRWWALAVAISCSLTLVNQLWIGQMTLYAVERAPARERLHQAILSNTLPPGVDSWTTLGANGSNVRVATVWTAEVIHGATGQPLNRVYFVMDTVGLFACCLLLYAFMTASAGALAGIVSLLYFGSVLPLTYVLHYFHPWDRPSLAVWLAALILARARRWVPLGLVLVVGVLVKYDILIFPLLVFLAERPARGLRAAAITAAQLLLVTLATYGVLRWAIPGGFEPRPVLALAQHNLGDLASYGPQHPPLLALSIPAALAILGYSRANDFAKAAANLALIIATILFLQVYFVEFRTEVALLPLLLPAASFAMRPPEDLFEQMPTRRGY